MIVLENNCFCFKSSLAFAKLTCLSFQIGLTFVLQFVLNLKQKKDEKILNTEFF